MKAKSIILATGDEYRDAEISSIEEGVLPKEFDSMVLFSIGKTKIYVNAAMIVSIEPDTQLKAVISS